jgi:phage baseplate assembly protein W
MSFDFQLGHSCPHLTVEEEVSLGSDRRSLQTRQPVASASKIRITVNDQFTIPKTGLLSRASLTGTQSGPFRIVKNENTLTVSNRSQELADVELPVGTRVSSSRVVDELTAALRGASVGVTVVSQKGHLVFSDITDTGGRSQVSVTGPAAVSLGFTHQTRGRGHKVYPGWDFGERPTIVSTPALASVRTVPARFPIFNEVVRGNPVFKVSYTTYQAQCRRCQSFGIENDYRIAATGEPLTVRNEDLLNQGALKILTTIKNSNPFHPEYGTTLLTRIGSKALGAGVSAINEDVITALNIFQRIQGLQGRYQEVTPRERLATVISINTTPSEFDPTVFEVGIVAANASNVPVVIRTVFAAPGTAALAGSNGLSLGLAGFGLDPRTRSLPGTAI